MAWNQINKERYKDNMLRNQFGISLEEYNILLAKQNGVCAICGKEDKKALAVDHDATTGRIRGLLCSTHNLAIGNFNHDPNLLRAAAKYLETSSTPYPRHTHVSEQAEAPSLAAAQYLSSTTVSSGQPFD